MHEKITLGHSCEHQGKGTPSKGTYQPQMTPIAKENCSNARGLGRHSMERSSCERSHEIAVFGCGSRFFLDTIFGRGLARRRVRHHCRLHPRRSHKHLLQGLGFKG